jgi:hypothetical protein
VEKEIEIKAFVKLGELMIALGEGREWEGYSVGATEEEYLSIQRVITKQFVYNGWFVKENVQKALCTLGGLLMENQLSAWLSEWDAPKDSKKIGVIMAGNIPLVGFHDFLCVLLSGHHVVCKLSSDDCTLLPALAGQLVQYAPTLKERISFSTGKLGKIDAIIATGSDNSAAYFEQYFGKYPHIFRKNRTSVAVLSGNETPEELALLGADIFTYFGLGCRNVSHLLLPKGYDLNRFFEAIMMYHPVVNHHKYANNYDYNKAVYLMNLMDLLDNNFVLLRQTEELFSPLAMVHYSYYEDFDDVSVFLERHKNSLQAVVGHGYIPFGAAQNPKLDDYADGINVLRWISEWSKG